MIGSLIGLQNGKSNLTTNHTKKDDRHKHLPHSSFFRPCGWCGSWFFFFLCAPLLQAGGAGEGREQPPIVRVTGVARLVGSGPGAELLLSTEDREWHIDEKDQDKLRKLQQQTVTVEGEASSQERIFADGRSAGEWFYLRNIKIIDPDHAATEN
jgi:hypothetical protein